MKVLFVGPSLYGCDVDLGGLTVRGPARQGDLHRAVTEGATAIGLIDGVFGSVPSVWHKEILHALSLGVRVLGGASLGALRAAECAAFGMEPVGGIAAEYVNGTRTADADVCLAHCPEELGYMPLSEPLVDVEATAVAMGAEGAALLERARGMFFADRTVETMTAGVPGLAEKYRAHSIARKSKDAVELVERLRALPEVRGIAPDWRFVESDPWRFYLKQAAASQDGSPGQARG